MRDNISVVESRKMYSKNTGSEKLLKRSADELSLQSDQETGAYNEFFVISWLQNLSGSVGKSSVMGKSLSVARLQSVQQPI